jgi:hypothetical protein
VHEQDLPEISFVDSQQLAVRKRRDGSRPRTPVENTHLAKKIFRSQPTELSVSSVDQYLTVDEYEHVLADIVFTDYRRIGRKIDFLDNLSDVQQFLRTHACKQRYVLKKRNSINRNNVGALTHVGGKLSST